MKVYLQLAKLHFTLYRQFLGALLSEFLSYPVMVFIAFGVWTSIFSLLPDLSWWKGTTLNQLLLYYAAVLAVNYSYSYIHYLHYQIWQDISTGRLSIFLCRPMDYFLYHLAVASGRLALRGGIVIVAFVAILASTGWGHLSHGAILGGAIAWIEASLVCCGIQFLLGVMTFWTEKIIALRDLVLRVLGILGGMVIPISFFPSALSEFLRISPFWFVFGYPAEVLAGSYPAWDPKTHALALLWMAILFISARILYRLGLKEYTASGG